jgi:hypothetical protein
MDDTTQQQTAEQPQLGVADLQNLRTLLDVASRRGAFAASEMTSVGAVFDRLNTFLNAIAPPAAQQATDDTQASGN